VYRIVKMAFGKCMYTVECTFPVLILTLPVKKSSRERHSFLLYFHHKYKLILQVAANATEVSSVKRLHFIEYITLHTYKRKDQCKAIYLVRSMEGVQTVRSFCSPLKCLNASSSLRPKIEWNCVLIGSRD
jgi:hypothetical protein